MRNLNDIEKNVVDYIIKYSKPEEGLENNVIFILSSILSKDEDKNFLECHLKEKKVWVKKRFKDSENNSTSSIIENVIPISKIVFCIDYLEKQNLISLVEYYYEEELKEDTLQMDMSNNSDYQEIKDIQIKDFILNNIRSGIFATQHLIQYKENGYKTEEQIRHEDQIEKMKQQIKWAIIAATIAAIGTLYPLLRKFIEKINIIN